MLVPFLSKRSDQQLHRRKGGGKSGGSGGGGRSGGSGSGRGSSRSSPINVGSGTTKPATSYGFGGGKATTIPSGQLFAGRSAGGGNRDQVFGNRQYGSGYPGETGRGVSGRGFPFFFWPLAWGGVAGVGTAAYLHNSEYGRFDNTSRPGGILMTAAFPSTSENSTYRVVADNSTIISLIEDIKSNCSSSLENPDTIEPSTYNDSLSSPKPEQAVEYYRASSVVLTLDNYNNTGALEAEGTPDTPLPSPIDTTLLTCLNETIGASVPLVDGATLHWSAPPSMGLIGLVYLIWSLSSFV
ncbi:hypothetical protein JR316_0003375 [Psilocybe cubensis]|uniref:Uncharacterized protein n=2 Tax=Psilocybe cubensis TaxID=181762 RepID=A0A8H8CNP8_PSICU|nr:hypothetical protein JR316_0003375 [Psilocybe cubensis]KAH9483897.1 hypothetical protein JR316_0003375 [Psilocybe cubensis]